MQKFNASHRLFSLPSNLLHRIATLILTPVLLSLSIDTVNTATGADKQSVPNIVLILADDLGVGDIQAHYPKNKIPTPHLDKLVRQAMSFSDAHSPSAVCSPTRYGLLTGRYAWRTRLQEWVMAAYEPPLIDADRPTLPGMLQRQGYHTACIGKWHLGWTWKGPQQGRMTTKRNGQVFYSWDFTKPIADGPTTRGFSYYFGVDLPNLPPFTFIEHNHVTVQPSERYVFDPEEGAYLPKGFQGTPIAPGWKFQEILPKLTQHAVEHIHQQAKQEQPFFLFFSMTSPHEPVAPSKKFRGRSGIAPIADFVMETDWSAGQIVKAVDEAGIADNTIVIFTADNGHSHYTGWEALIEAGHMPSGPFRGHKGDIWEGGHREPLVIRWPGHVAAGSESTQLVCLTDLFATCAEVAGAKLPEHGAEDSLSFLPSLLKGKSPSPRQTLVSHSNFGEFAYRSGPWKLVFKLGEANLNLSRGKPTVAELYNLKTDIGEAQELSQQHSKVVQRLTQALQDVIQRGATRPEIESSNDTLVRFQTTQSERWAPALKKK